jgi:hypothetical protein
VAEEALLVLIVLVIIVVVIVAAALAMRKKKSFCPSCGVQWRDGAMSCMRCKYSPFLPPAHVAIDTSNYDYGPPRPTMDAFEGDHRDPWVRRNF